MVVQPCDYTKNHWIVKKKKEEEKEKSSVSFLADGALHIQRKLHKASADFSA